MNDRIDPQFPRYRIGAPEGEPNFVGTTFDGPRVDAGRDVEVRFVCRVEELPTDERLADGIPIRLRVLDFSGPRVLAEDGVSLLGEDTPAPAVFNPGHAAVLAATIHEALHPEYPWDALPAAKQGALAGLFARMVADGVFTPGPAITGGQG